MNMVNGPINSDTRPKGASKEGSL